MSRPHRSHRRGDRRRLGGAELASRDEDQVPVRLHVLAYVESAAAGGDLRTIPTLYVGARSPDLVGVSKAARIAGVTRSGIVKAHERGRMPEPIPVAGSDVLVWRRENIEQWAFQRPGPGRPSLSRILEDVWRARGSLQERRQVRETYRMGRRELADQVEADGLVEDDGTGGWRLTDAGRKTLGIDAG